MWRWQQIAAVLKAPRFGAELGVAGGRFTSHLLSEFPDLYMFAVDEWKERPALSLEGYETYAGWEFSRLRREFGELTAPYKDRLTVIEQDTEEAAKLIQDGTLDFVFIDAEHTYEGVRDDIAAWRSKLVPGGLLSGHDYSKKFPGVKQAVDELGLPTVFGRDTVWMIRL